MIQKRNFYGRRKRNALYEHNGQSLTLQQWSAATGIEYTTLTYRMLKKGMSIGEAIQHDWHQPIAKPERMKPLRFSFNIGDARVDVKITPGVVADFASVLGTGGGSTAQESTDLTFSQEAAE